MNPSQTPSQTIDEVNLLVCVPAEREIGPLEYELNLEGYTLGYLPVDSRVKTLGEALARRVPNHYAPRYGEIDDICLSLTAAWKKKNITTKKVSRAATGPDLKQIFIGSGNLYGHVTEAILRICPFPGARRDVAITFPSSAHKNNFLKSLSNSGLRPLFLIDVPKTSKLESALVGPAARLDAEVSALKRLVREHRGTVTLS